MVGHSLGGLLVRMFSERFEGEVVGFVFVDSSHPEQMERFPPEVVESTPGPPPLFLLKAAAATGVLRLMSAPVPAGLPEEVGDLVARFFPRSVAGVLGELEASQSIAEQATETGMLGDRPLVVLTAGPRSGPLPPTMSEEVDRKLRETWLVLHLALRWRHASPLPRSREQWCFSR